MFILLEVQNANKKSFSTIGERVNVDPSVLCPLDFVRTYKQDDEVIQYTSEVSDIIES